MRKALLSAVFFLPSAVLAWETSDCSTTFDQDEKAIIQLGHTAETYINQRGQLPDLYEGMPDLLSDLIPPELANYLIHGSTHSDRIGFTCSLGEVDKNGVMVEEKHYRECYFVLSDGSSSCESKVLLIEWEDS